MYYNVLNWIPVGSAATLPNGSTSIGRQRPGIDALVERLTPTDVLHSSTLTTANTASPLATQWVHYLYYQFLTLISDFIWYQTYSKAVRYFSVILFLSAQR